MSFPEYQMPGVRTARGPGEAYPYWVPFTQAQLVTMLPGLNIFPKLPAGTLIDIAGHYYRTLQDLDAGTPGPQIGAMVPMGPHRPSVVGPKDASVFADRANVYWDPVNNCFTATVVGTVIGYAVSNPYYGSAANPKNSTLNVTPAVGATEYNAVATITGGTSADGQVGCYAATDTMVEVELIGN